jgi:hypothetical protein
MLAFVETRLFSRLVDEYLRDEEYALLQAALALEIPKLAL